MMFLIEVISYAVIYWPIFVFDRIDKIFVDVLFKQTLTYYSIFVR